jgi:hypothetical protein
MRNRSLIFYALLSILVLGALIYGFYRKSASDELARVTEHRSGSIELKDIVTGGNGGSANGPRSVSDGASCPSIMAIDLIPKRPTRNDNIKAVAKVESKESNASVSYMYKWFVNDKLIEAEKGDTLRSGPFKKRDKISVDITPSADGNTGISCQSPLIIVDNAPPILSLREEVGGKSELQLVGEDPDGDKITYSLEVPLLTGMTIDKDTGLITWKHVGMVKGKYIFTASATDSDGAKTVRTFEISLDVR